MCIRDRYNFDDNIKNMCDESGTDEAQLFGKAFAEYTGEIVYETGIKGKAVRVGNYGFDLNKKNLGTDFNVSMWVKPDGTFLENDVMLFLGHHEDVYKRQVGNHPESAKA